jgi:hypothetical protein
MHSRPPGAVAVRMRVHDTPLLLVCCHLASGDAEGDEARRNSDAAEILRRCAFPTDAQMAALGLTSEPPAVCDSSVGGCVGLGAQQAGKLGAPLPLAPPVQSPFPLHAPHPRRPRPRPARPLGQPQRHRGTRQRHLAGGPELQVGGGGAAGREERALLPGSCHQASLCARLAVWRRRTAQRPLPLHTAHPPTPRPHPQEFPPPRTRRRAA